MKCIYKILAAWPNKQKVLFWNERPEQMIWQNGLTFSKKCIYQCAFTVTVTIIYDLFAYDNNMVFQFNSLLITRTQNTNPFQRLQNETRFEVYYNISYLQLKNYSIPHLFEVERVTVINITFLFANTTIAEQILINHLCKKNSFVLDTVMYHYFYFSFQNLGHMNYSGHI